jgi:hypothetical protein
MFNQSAAAADDNPCSDFFNLVMHPFKFRFFLLSKLPSAYFSGVRVRYIDEKKAIVTVPYKWFSKNPFKSTYFACLSMAAEMSTGVLAMAHIHKRRPGVSMLVLSIQGNFYKKASGVTTFTCEDGELAKQTIEEALARGDGRTLAMVAIGKNEAGEVVATFEITWSFKGKSK